MRSGGGVDLFWSSGGIAEVREAHSREVWAWEPWERGNSLAFSDGGFGFGPRFFNDEGLEGLSGPNLWGMHSPHF